MNAVIYWSAKTSMGQYIVKMLSRKSCPQILQLQGSTNNFYACKPNLCKWTFGAVCGQDVRKALTSVPSSSGRRMLALLFSIQGI